MLYECINGNAVNENVFLAFVLTVIAGFSTGIGSALAFFARKTNKGFLSMALGFSAPLLGLALWIRRFAAKVNRAGRYPPPDARLTRDTRVRTGDAAGAIARLQYFLAGLMALLAIAVPILLWRVYDVLFGS